MFPPTYAVLLLLKAVTGLDSLREHHVAHRYGGNRTAVVLVLLSMNGSLLPTAFLFAAIVVIGTTWEWMWHHIGAFTLLAYPGALIGVALGLVLIVKTFNPKS